MKQYFGISRDHSVSMSSLTKAAAKDYNNNIAAIKEASEKEKIDTIVSVVECGSGSANNGVKRSVVNSSVNRLEAMDTYMAMGYSTPLFDSVGELITLLEATPDANDADVSFLIMAITDGEENSSRKWDAIKLGDKIRKLQSTDRWTFVFRVPKGYGRKLEQLGIPDGNIQEWEQTSKGMEQSSAVTTQAVSSYFSGLRSGSKSTTKFYADLSNVKPSQVKKKMVDISNEVQIFSVKLADVKAGKLEIKDFIQKKTKRPILIGSAFYQLSKPEKAVQDHKLICIRDKKTKAIYAGGAARDLLGLPHVGNIKLVPGDHGNYDIFIQSKSTNRHLMSGTDVMLWFGAMNLS